MATCGNPRNVDRVLTPTPPAKVVMPHCNGAEWLLLNYFRVCMDSELEHGGSLAGPKNCFDGASRIPEDVNAYEV